MSVVSRKLPQETRNEFGQQLSIVIPGRRPIRIVNRLESPRLVTRSLHHQWQPTPLHTNPLPGLLGSPK